MKKLKSRRKREKVLVFGSSGQIGSRAVQILSEYFSLITPIHSKVDIKNRDLVAKFIKASKPDQILYIAGYTNTDGAREESGESFWLNAGAPLHLSFIAESLKIPIHYLSTELVFNGLKNDRPYKEIDQPDPLLTNGKTKRLGELVTLDASPKNSVLRLIMCYSPHYPRKMDIARLAVSKLKQNQEFTATNDQKVNPIYVDHLAQAISVALLNHASGIYHLGATTYTTPFDFVVKIAKKMGLNHKLIKSTSFAKFSKTRPEKRPRDQWLDVSKFQRDFGKGILKSLDEGVNQFAKDYQRLN